MNRPRGLCWGCYYTPGVKEMFPTISKFGKRFLAEVVNPRFVLPKDLCPHPPGSDEKIRVMAERAEKGESLFHPLDADFGRKVPTCNTLYVDSGEDCSDGD